MNINTFFQWRQLSSPIPHMEARVPFKLDVPWHRQQQNERQDSWIIEPGIPPFRVGASLVAPLDLSTVTLYVSAARPSDIQSLLDAIGAPFADSGLVFGAGEKCWQDSFLTFRGMFPLISAEEEKAA